jgi:hypothetical protein
MDIPAWPPERPKKYENLPPNPFFDRRDQLVLAIMAGGFAQLGGKPSDLDYRDGQMKELNHVRRRWFGDPSRAGRIPHDDMFVVLEAYGPGLAEDAHDIAVGNAVAKTSARSKARRAAPLGGEKIQGRFAESATAQRVRKRYASLIAQGEPGEPEHPVLAYARFCYLNGEHTEEMEWLAALRDVQTILAPFGVHMHVDARHLGMATQIECR